MKKSKRIAALLIVLAILLSSCGIKSVDEFTGRVVNSDSGDPLSGVILLAIWPLTQGGFHGLSTNACVQAIEVITSEDGQFNFPSWDYDENAPRVSKAEGSIGEPTVYVYKQGYKLLLLENRDNDPFPKHMWPENVVNQKYGAKNVIVKLIKEKNDTEWFDSSYSFYSTLEDRNTCHSFFKHTNWKIPISMKKKREIASSILAVCSSGDILQYGDNSKYLCADIVRSEDVINRAKSL